MAWGEGARDGLGGGGSGWPGGRGLGMAWGGVKRLGMAWGGVKRLGMARPARVRVER